MSRWPLLLAALASLAAVGVAIPFAIAGGTGTATTRITVTASDFKFRLSQRNADAGKVVITLVNRGKTRHDIRIGGKKTQRIAPGARATLSVTLRAGRAAFVCTVPGHARLGMRGTLTVKQPPPTTEETNEETTEE